MPAKELLDKAHKFAIENMDKSYAPYSNLHVSSVLCLKGTQQLVAGVNVENVSYGATLCAERSAVVSARSQWGEFSIDFIVIISDIKGDPIPPCGMCLQVLAEFAEGTTPIYLGDKKELGKEQQLKDFLPHAFSKEMLLSGK